MLRRMPSAEEFEAALPSWQRWVNEQAEGWIFAFVVAMALKHFLLEPFTIPSASMEPMMIGDPGFMKGDLVVVDKALSRFRTPQRWDVTVFQFPVPEVESRQGRDAAPATDAADRRVDSWATNPLLCRSFVKRLLVLPGDRFYFAGGDLHLAGPDGTFRPAVKPPAVQEALWLGIYRHGAQDGYLPWSATGGAAVEGGSALAFRLVPGGRVAFTQPLWNLYLKPNPVLASQSAPQGHQVTGVRTVAPVSLERPIFTVGGVEGSIWDLAQGPGGFGWHLWRLNAKDLDANHGTYLNPLMDEWVGDLRLSGRIASLEGRAQLHLRYARELDLACEINPSGWRVLVDGQERSKGDQSPIGQEFAFARIDGQVVVRLGGRELHRSDLVPVDGNRHRCALSWEGEGSLVLDGAALSRDVHYSARGFLADATAEAKSLDRDLSNPELRGEAAAEAQRNLKLIAGLRSSLLQREAVGREARAPLGSGPDNAITAPPGAYLLLGDNSPHSWDSRMWGWVPEENLRGRALVVLWPFQRAHLLR